MPVRCPHCRGEIDEATIEVLRGREALLQKAQELVHLGSYERSHPPGGQDYWSPEIYRIVGLPPDEPVPDREEFLRRCVHPADRDRVREVLRASSDRGEPHEVEYRVVRPDGEVRVIHSVGEPVRDRKGRIVKLVGTLLDITERRRAEDALRDREARLSAILSTDVEGIVTISDAGIIESFNPGAEKMFGYAEAEVLGRPVTLLMPSPFREDHESHVRRYLETGEARIIGIGREVEGLRRDGTTFPMDLSVADVKVVGRRLFTGICRDVTERKRLEQEFLEAQKMEAIGRLAGGIAHDFNNLLMGVRGCCRLAAERLDRGSAALGPIDEIRAAVDVGAALTRQLFAFSRKRRFAPAPMRLNEGVTAAVRLIRQLVGEDVRLRVLLASTGRPILAAPGQVEQVLMNLAVNARDAMPDGGELTIETADGGRDAGGRPEVRLTVSDTGTGMEPAVRARAFEPFFTTKGAGEGSGLGLSTVYGIVRQLGGRIELTTEPGAGTTFGIWLPTTDRPPPEPEAEPGERDAAGGGETVLVVEDERLVRISVCDFLRRIGYEVLEAPGPVEALSLAGEREGDVDLLLTDIVLPGMGGSDLARELQSRSPGLRAIFMSAYPEEMLVEQGRLEPGRPTIEKPFDLEDLAAKLRQVLDS